MKQVIRGHRLALDLIYERYADKLIWYANGFLGDQSAAQDVVQEVFLTLIEVPERFDANRTFSTWIYTVTANKCRNMLRQTRQQQERQQSHAYLNRHNQERPQNRMDVSRLETELTHLHRTLTPKEQDLFRLRFAEKLPIKEIAARMNLPEGSVKSGLYYLLKKYTPLLQRYQHE